MECPVLTLAVFTPTNGISCALPLCVCCANADTHSGAQDEKLTTAAKFATAAKSTAYDLKYKTKHLVKITINVRWVDHSQASDTMRFKTSQN